VTPNPDKVKNGIIQMKASIFILLLFPLLLYGVSAEASIKLIRMKNKIEGQYIVVFKKREENLATKAFSPFNKLAFIRKHRLLINKEYNSALDGMAFQASESEALKIADDPNVDYVEEDSIATKASTPTITPWNLDRIDQRSIPLN
jgi:hypothetical protein